MSKRKQQTSEPNELPFLLATANLLAEIPKQDREAISGMAQGLRHIHHIRGQISPEYVRPLVENIERLSPEMLDEVIPLLKKGDPPTLLRLSNQGVPKSYQERVATETEAAKWRAVLARLGKLIDTVRGNGLDHLTTPWKAADMTDFAQRCDSLSASLAETAAAARALVNRRRWQDRNHNL